MNLDCGFYRLDGRILREIRFQHWPNVALVGNVIVDDKFLHTFGSPSANIQSLYELKRDQSILTKHFERQAACLRFIALAALLVP